jgi:DNA-binding transcriptional LysR family regulator
MLNLERLTALVAVEEAGSITQAASGLNVTAPALSQKLSKLERDVGHQLLIRKSTGCELTQVGRTLVQHARSIFELVSDAERDLARLSGFGAGRCVIGSFATAGVHLVPPVLAQFQKLLPGIVVELREFEPPNGLLALGEGRIDFTLSHIYSHGPQPVTPDGVVEEEIATEEILVLAGTQTRLASATGAIDWRVLAEEPLICGSPTLADRIALEGVFDKLGLGRPRVTYETSNYEIACRLAEENLGVALVPRMALMRSTGRATIHNLRPPGFRRTITIAWRDRYPTAPVTVLRRLFKRASLTVI